MNRAALFAILVAAIGGFWLWSPQGELREERHALPSLVVDERALDFGEQWEQSRFEMVLPVRNESSHHISADLISSCSCTSVNPHTHSLSRRAIQRRFD